MSAETRLLPQKHHDAVLDWQRRSFPDYPHLLENWEKFYNTRPFELAAKLGEARSPVVEVGRHRGRPKFERAREMDADMVEQCKKIIRAQASTDLAAVQQHAATLPKSQDPRLQFDVLRVMAEELRHGYQMIYLLASDDWGEGAADAAIEELLAMRTGTHVLDAFNIYFDSFVDNIVYTAIVDRVGKYQLGMQSVSAYAPVARSTGPMLREEAFHLATGVAPLRLWAAEAAQQRGNVSVAMIQKHVNKWLPRALELFGDERGGDANLDFGFKDMRNAEAMERFYREVKAQAVDEMNRAIVRTRVPDASPERALEIAEQVVTRGERRHGLDPEDLLYLPSPEFYRRRGVHAFKTVDAAGKPILRLQEYQACLRSALPDTYVASNDFSSYLTHLRKHMAGTEADEAPLAFFG
jgi:1,2-phenylacetyl-CoA epoxidase catalytic subunit